MSAFALKNLKPVLAIVSLVVMSYAFRGTVSGSLKTEFS